MSTPRIVRPQPGPQEDFLASSADIAIAGGAAGVGKTFGLTLEGTRHVRNPDFGAVFFRRTYQQVTQQGGLWDTAYRLYPALGARPNDSDLFWAFPKGAEIKYAHMQHLKDRIAWDGSQVCLLGFDQLESFLEQQFWYMFSRNRSTCGVRPYIRATCNPVPDDDPIGGWLRKLIDWWIGEDGYPIKARAGKVRWFARIQEQLEWADSREALIARFPKISPIDLQPKSLTFIPGKLEDNPILLRENPDYRGNLLAMTLVERERLLGGNWNIRPEAGKVFNRAWFEIVDAAPVDAQRVRYWDKAGTEDGGDWSAGVRMSRTPEGIYFVEDSERGQWSPKDRNVVMKQKAEADGRAIAIWIEQEPGSGGKESAQISIVDLAGWNVRAEPVTGDKLTRAQPFAAQAEARNVKVVRGPWNEAWLSEHHRFTGKEGGVDDQVDASSGAFNKLTIGGGGVSVGRVIGA